MLDSRDQLAELVSSAGKEIARLSRAETIDARDELRFRIWPFLVDLTETVQAALDEENDEVGSIPVDIVARAVGLLLTMANHLGHFLSKQEMESLAARAARVTEELMGLCDPDELATYVGDDGAHVPAIDAEILLPAEGPSIIDTTAETVDSSTEPSSGEAAVTETVDS